MHESLSFRSAIALFLAFWLAACGGSATDPQVEATFEVDPTVEPNADAISFVDDTGSRPLASIVDGQGRQIDFVEDEVILTLDDRDALPAILERLHGTVIREVDPNATGLLSEPSPIFVLLRVNPPDAEASDLAELIMAQGENGGQHRVSSQKGLNTLMAMARESVNEGTDLGANFLFTYDELSDRETAESPSGDASGYSANAFELPYMNRGSRQDIGAAEAARMVHEAVGVPTGRNRVDFMIMDGGFLNIPDYPGAEIIPRGRFSRINPPNSCSGGGDCPWHGTNVASAALGVFDDNIGAAGPAAEVVNPIFVQSPRPNLWDYLDYVFDTVPSALGRFPDIVNISASGDIPAGLCLVGVCTAVDVVGRSVRAAGILVFASAGNDGANVDSRDCGPFGLVCWEGAYRVPCEAPGVICVGGLQHDRDTKATNSATGSKQRDSRDSVDVYAPYSVWVHDTPTRGAGLVPPTTSATLKNGTSFASPFAAGIAALIKAASPRLGPGEIWEIMRDTAHTKARGSVHRWVNAQGAVQRALGGAPPFVRIERPTADERFSIGGSVPLSCDVQDDDGMDDVTVAWASDLDGSIGAASSFTSATRLRSGVHEITCTATDGRFTVSDSVQISVGNEAPTVVITAPTGSDPLYTGNAIAVTADAYDVDANLDDVYWQVINDFGFPTGWTATGREATIPRGHLAPGRYTLVATAYDTEGERAQDTRRLVIQANPSNLGPSINSLSAIATPTDPYDTDLAYWADACTFDVNGDGRVDGADLCQRLRFVADVTDDHDPVSALTFQWNVYEEGVLVDSFMTSTPTITLDFEIGQHSIELVASDTESASSQRALSVTVITLF
ncbi:MAG: S8/S53 family peptidase [Myxococcales bacterium]|nr:S8/S53 family peptidase [Myxococcales bacterium]MDH3483777.1 S8/S53 family peptidase [Myxococcales bacterium]